MTAILIGVCAFLVMAAWPEATIAVILYGILLFLGYCGYGKIMVYGFLSSLAAWVAIGLLVTLYRHLTGSPGSARPRRARSSCISISRW